MLTKLCPINDSCQGESIQRSLDKRRLVYAEHGPVLTSPFIPELQVTTLRIQGKKTATKKKLCIYF